MNVNFFVNMLAQVETMTGRALIMRIALFVIVAAIFFVVGVLSQQRKRGKGRWIKYIFGLLPLIAGIWFSMDFFWFANDGFNKGSGLLNDNREVLFKAAPFVCLTFALLVVIGGIIIDRKQDEQTSDML